MYYKRVLLNSSKEEPIKVFKIIYFKGRKYSIKDSNGICSPEEIIQKLEFLNDECNDKYYTELDKIIIKLNEAVYYAPKIHLFYLDEYLRMLFSTKNNEKFKERHKNLKETTKSFSETVYSRSQHSLSYKGLSTKTIQSYFQVNLNI